MKARTQIATNTEMSAADIHKLAADITERSYQLFTALHQQAASGGADQNQATGATGQQ
jgi:hypothetical protein